MAGIGILALLLAVLSGVVWLFWNDHYVLATIATVVLVVVAVSARLADVQYREHHSLSRAATLDETLSSEEQYLEYLKEQYLLAAFDFSLPPNEDASHGNSPPPVRSQIAQPVSPEIRSRRGSIPKDALWEAFKEGVVNGFRIIPARLPHQVRADTRIALRLNEMYERLGDPPHSDSASTGAGS